MTQSDKEHRKFKHYGLEAGLTLRPGGVLESIEWEYDEAAGQGNYVAYNRTATAHWHLFDCVTLDPDLRLKDIFLLLAQCPPLADLQRRNWGMEYVEHALSVEAVPYTGDYDPDGIEYLELKDHWELNSTTGELETNHRLDFHGIGFERREDQFARWNNDDGSPAIEYAKGERTSWAIEFTPLAELLDLPLKINPVVAIREGDHDVWKKRWDAGEKGPLHEWKMAWGWTLGQVVDGVLYEISFCGGPEDKADKREEIFDHAAEIREMEAAGEPLTFHSFDELTAALDADDEKD